MNHQHKQLLTPELKQKLEQFVKDRNAAFLSKDKVKILEHCRKYNVPIPRSEDSFWIMVHKVIVHLENIDPEQRAESVEWLESRGYSTDLG